MQGALPAKSKPQPPAFYLCGPVFTAAAPPGDNLWLHRAVDKAAPGDVIVADIAVVAAAGRDRAAAAAARETVEPRGRGESTVGILGRPT